MVSGDVWSVIVIVLISTVCDAVFTLCVAVCYSVFTLCVVCDAVFTLGNNAYGQCARKILDTEDHRSVTVVLNHFVKST